MKQIGGAGVGGKENVEEAVIINIGVSRTPRHSRSGEGCSHLRRHFLKLAAAEVAKQVRGLSVAYAFLHPFDLILNVAVGNEDVRPAIVIVIKEETSEAKGDQRSPAHFRLRSL